MKIETVAEHSYCPDLLPENANILDLGCRGFLFTNYFRGNGHNVIAVDIDSFERTDYKQIAIAGHNGLVGIERGNDPQGTRVKPGQEIPSLTLERFILIQEIEFDLIKMDIEGSEYDVIMSLTKAPAKQLSIEFHLHTGVYGLAEVNEMVNKLESLGYKIMQHERTKAHGCGENYWDSLFILQ